MTSFKIQDLSHCLQRTLRDYTHWFKSKPGFQVKVDKFLREEAKVEEHEGWKRYACMCVWGGGGGGHVCVLRCADIPIHDCLHFIEMLQWLLMR